MHLVTTAALFTIFTIFTKFLARFNTDFQDGPVVKTKSGKILGREARTSGLNKTYYAFQGIPYAEPPIGNLRFRPPVPVKKWYNIINATQDPQECVQGAEVITGSEDCLYLSVYTTYFEQEDDILLPVMVWIHGGVFWKGNSSYEEYGPDYFLDQDVVMVTLNYRLGIFGFLSTEDMVAPGNYGMKDQVLALKWVRRNIIYFGGDPDRVTLFGQSAGSASTSYHLQSKLSKGLFQRAIMESGTSLCLWALSRRAQEAAFLVGEELNLSANTTEELVDDLRIIDYIDLQVASNLINFKLLLGDNPTNGLIFTIVPEPKHRGAFFTGKSHKRLSCGQFHHIPTIIGFNGKEGSIDITLPMRIWLLKYDAEETLFVPGDMNISADEQLALGVEIKHYYFGVTSVTIQTEEIIQFVSDDQFIRPIRETVKLQSKYAPVYFYRFTYESSLGGNLDKQEPGTRHSEELPYMWRSNIAATFKDALIRDRFIKLWTNFAKYGNPTPTRDKLLNHIKWPAANVSKNDLAFLNIDEKLTVQLNPRKKVLEYWDDLYRSKGNPPFDTY